MTNHRLIQTTLVVFLIVGIASVFIAYQSLNVKVVQAASGTSGVNSFVVVPTFCDFTVSNTQVTFNAPGSFGVPPGTNVATANLIIVYNANGNIAGNVFVAGANWISGPNNFYVGNTLWNPTASASYVGTALGLVTNGMPPYTPLVNTNIALPIGASNNIYFGLAIPQGQAAGTYTQNVVFQNTCSTGPSNSLDYNVLFVVNVPSTCYIYLSNSFIVFGSVNPGISTTTSNLVVVNSLGGNSNTNVVIEGTNWTTAGHTFYVSNTVWNPTSATNGVGNQLYLQPGNFQNTNIIIPYPPTTSSNNIYFGVHIPAGQAAATYTQNIIMEDLC